MPTFDRIGMMEFQTKSFDPATGVFVGLASTPQLDRMREVVSSDAMREAAERYMKNPLITWQHDLSEPIGKAVSVRVTEEGTLLEGYITDKTDDGRKVRGLMEDGIVRSLSIGFNPYSRSYGPHQDGTPDYDVTEEDDDRRPRIVWKRIDWLETAVCSVPCNPGAVIALGKSLGLEMETPDPEPGDAADLTQKKNDEADTTEPTAGLTKAEREEARFLADVERVRTGAVSVGNIVRHWRKEGRDLSPDVISGLTQAVTELRSVLESNPAAVVPEAEQAAPCLLTLPAPSAVKLQLPAPLRLPDPA
jgi:HK97 family phage prohead protease